MDAFLDNTATELDPQRNPTLDSFLDNTITQRDPERNSTLDSFLDNTVTHGETGNNVNNLFVANVGEYFSLFCDGNKVLIQITKGMRKVMSH